MVLQDAIETIVEHAREHEVVLILLARKPVYELGQLARAVLVSKLTYA